MMNVEMTACDLRAMNVLDGDAPPTPPTSFPEDAVSPDQLTKILARKDDDN